MRFGVGLSLLVVSACNCQPPALVDGGQGGGGEAGGSGGGGGSSGGGATGGGTELDAGPCLTRAGVDGGFPSLELGAAPGLVAYQHGYTARVALLDDALAATEVFQTGCDARPPVVVAVTSAQALGGGAGYALAFGDFADIDVIFLALAADGGLEARQTVTFDGGEVNSPFTVAPGASGVELFTVTTATDGGGSTVQLASCDLSCDAHSSSALLNGRVALHLAADRPGSDGLTRLVWGGYDLQAGGEIGGYLTLRDGGFDPGAQSTVPAAQRRPGAATFGKTHLWAYPKQFTLAPVLLAADPSANRLTLLSPLGAQSTTSMDVAYDLFRARAVVVGTRELWVVAGDAAGLTRERVAPLGVAALDCSLSYSPARRDVGIACSDGTAIWTGWASSCR